jgi:PAS domain S-box-containing protein
MNMQQERIKVLYVDDEEGNLMAFRATFRREFDVRTSPGGADALEAMEQDLPHVIISDQRMPRMSGSELLAIVRERWPRVIRILLTGYADIEAVIDAVNKGGIHAYITKPWDPMDLRLRIQQAHEMHALRAERERLFQRYRQVFEASGDPIVIVDHEGRFLEMNPAAEKALGMQRSEWTSRKCTDLIQEPHALMRDLQRHRKGRTFSNIEVSVTTPGGRVLECLLTATWLGRGPAGGGHFQAVIKDITDRKQEEERLRKLNTDLDRRVAVRTRQLREALDDLNAFSYSVAHDLRSPLKSMRSFTEHLRGLALMNADPELRMVSDRLHHNADRLLALVDDLLRFAHTDQQSVQRSPVDLGRLAREVFKELQEQGRQMELVAPGDGTAIIDADPAMLAVALGNLLSNAVKFTREQEQARITVNLEQRDDHPVITVRDNGIGFDPAKAGDLFGVFKRLHRPDQYEGTGIGLAMVQRIAQKHGGSCWAESRPGEGATFHLSLPPSANDRSLRKAV